ncbi:DUF5333 domain-containing protein [Roseovarius salinarum]|uniref:DUF5333 domain-containing protein n=1 Tax=Roseovarius salinarum TaxID=1981892 RepID=UPI0012FFFE87|nr:DUF5333 domain-containing protein [Roseovarius salinarum]
MAVHKASATRAGRLAAAALACALIAAPAAQAGKPGLAQEDDINAGLLAVGIADEIRDHCPTISGRVFKALFYMNGLKRMARERGYTDDEIDAYVDSDAEKARMREKGEAYLARHGVDRDTPETFCDLGRAEIARGSRIGSFLRAR